MFKVKASRTLVAWFQTINLNVLVFALGCIFGLTGATLIDLGDIYLTTPKIVSYTIAARGTGSILFCLFAGFILRHVNMQIVMIVSALVAAICLALTPLWGNLVVCFVMFFFIGGGIGLMETSTNVWVIAIWKEKSGPFFQFINFSFGFGGVIAPIVAGPFLSQITERTRESFVLNSTEQGGTVVLPFVADTQVYIPYLMLGLLWALVVAMFVFSYFVESSDIIVKEDEHSDSSNSHKWELTMVTVYCLYVFVFVALEQTYVAMLAVYAVEQLEFSKSDSVYVSAIFWIFFTISRIIATFASFKMKTTHMLFICHAIVMIAAVWLVIMGGSSPITLWICTAMMGFGVSPMFATALTYTMQYVLLSNTYMSWTMLCVCAGSMTPPLLVAPYIEDNPIAFVYIILGLTVASCLGLLGLMLLAKGKNVRPSMVSK